MDDKITELLDSIKDISQEEFDERFGSPISKYKSKFYDEKRYLNGLKPIIKQVDNGGYDDSWTDEIASIFDFVYDNGLEISLADDDILCVKHENNYYELFEMHGQGCYQSIVPISNSVHYVDFEDIVRYYETGKKPLSVNMMELVHKGLAAVEAVNDGNHIIEINNEKISLQNVYEYILERVME